ncbi:MAG: hypothetical protein K2G19_00240 [Lachnospiraceae bacterium]|nr:hypothetical protein [Lachnospiraceae bacterium]
MMDYQFSNLPLGLGMVLAMNERARAGYDSLSETEKEHIILKCKDARSRKEMDQIIDSLSSSEGIADLFRGPNIG